MKILKYIIFSLVLTLSLSGGEVIETLPTRERAEMNIEVTKVFSEKLDALLDESNKEITLNFKETTIDESQFEVFLIENLNTLPSFSVSKGGRRALEVIKNGAKLRAGSKITTGKLSYFLDRAKGKKALKIQYEEKPEKLYLGVLNKSTNTVAKVFSINYDTPTTYAKVNISLTGEFKNEMIFTDDKIFDNIDPIVSKEGSGSVTATLDNYLDGNNSGEPDKRRHFRLSAIIGGSSSYKEPQNPGNTVVNNTLSSDYKQPQVSIVGKGPFNIKLELESSNPVQTFKENESIVAYRGKDTKVLIVQLKPSISSEIIKAARSINSLEVSLDWSNNNQLNQIAFPLASWTTVTNGTNWIATIPSQYLTEQEKQEPIKIATYPSLKIVKTQTTYNGTIESNAKNSSIVSQDTNFLRGLNSKGSIEIFKTSETSLPLASSNISETGSTDQDLIFEVINNSGNKMKFKIKYTSGNPSYELIDYIKSNSDDTSEEKRTFNFVIKHYEESGLLRKTDNVKVIVAENTNNLVVNHNVGEEVTYLDQDRKTLTNGSGIPTYAVFLGGILNVTLENFTIGKIPILTLGKSSFTNATNYYAYDTYNQFNNLFLEHGNYKFSTRIHFWSNYFPNIFLLQHLTKEVVVGKHTNNSTENNLSFSTELKLNIPESNIIEMRKEERFANYEILLTPEVNNFNVITAIIGKQNEQATLFTADSNSDPKITIPYPKIKFVKDNVTQSGIVNLNTSYKKGTTIDFDKDGVATSNTATLDATSRFPQGLSYGGTMEIYQGETKIGETMNVNGLDKYKEAGETSKHQFTLKDHLGRDAKISLQYRTDGLVSFSLDEWEGEGEINFTIFHKEGSGLIRKTTNMKIVTPKIGEEKNKGILDFGVLLKGSNINYTAETSIVVQPFSGHNLILELDSSNTEKKVSLTNGDSTVEATGLSIDFEKVDGTNKVFKLRGVITKDNLDKSTAEGAHTGTIILQMKVVPATTVNLNNK